MYIIFTGLLIGNVPVAFNTLSTAARCAPYAPIKTNKYTYIYGVTVSGRQKNRFVKLDNKLASRNANICDIKNFRFNRIQIKSHNLRRRK